MSKKENIKLATGYYTDYLAKVFSSTDEWKDYLKFASNLYKYKFAESLLIYAQNPNATACATLEQWNSIGRWVKKGSTSMKIIDDTEGDISLKYVFDLKDTTGTYTTVPKKWKARHPKQIMSIIQDITKASSRETFSEMIINHVKQEIYDNENYMKQFTDEDKEKMTPAFRTALNDTVLYLICQRCEVKIPDNYKLFETLMNIEDKSMLPKLGIMAIAESSTLLRQIEYQVKKQENLIRKGEIKNVEQIWNKNQEISTRGISSEVRRIDNEWNNRGENIGETTGNNGIQRENNRTIETTEPITERTGLSEESTIREANSNASGRNATRDDIPTSINIPREGENLSLFSLPEIKQENKEESSKPYKINDIVVIENREYKITKINIEKDEIELFDLKIANIYPLYRVMPVSEFELSYEPYTEDVEYNMDCQFTAEPSGILSSSTIENGSDESIKAQTSEVIKNNFVITDETELGKGSLKEKYDKNIQAIKLLKELESTNRLATQEEQKILAGYSGWGGNSKVFDKNSIEWKEEYKELQELLTDEEYEQAKGSVLNAFYTEPTIIKAIYDGLNIMGFKKGNILEPSAGIGNFFGLLPEEMRESNLTGVELDKISGKILKQLYQKADIHIKGFEDANIPDNYYDIAISNVPFGNYSVYDPVNNKQNFLIHDYFFSRALDKVREGGIVAFITSKGTMDKKDSTVRKVLSEKADFIGAIRLPTSAFKKTGHTEVTTDIIFLRKKDGTQFILDDWIDTEKYEDEKELDINKYFMKYPQLVLGKLNITTNQYGKELEVKEKIYSNLKDDLNRAIKTVCPANIYKELEKPIELNKNTINTIPADYDVKNYTFTVINNKIYQRVDDVMVEQKQEGVTAERIKGMIQIRDTLKQLIDVQLLNNNDSEMIVFQAKLNKLYDNYVAKYGYLTSRGNKLAFEDDIDYPLLTALEDIDEETKEIKKSGIFFTRTISPYKEITEVETSKEALMVSLSQKGKIDIEYMMNLCDKDYDTLISELKGTIFRNPIKINELNKNDRYAGWETADEYLSGNVREKLKIAKAYSENDEQYLINVQYLKENQPAELSAEDIEVRLGATWIPPEIIKDFIKDTFKYHDDSRFSNGNLRINYSRELSRWYIENKPYISNVETSEIFGTKRMNGYDILESSLNLKYVTIYDTKYDKEKGEDVSVVNQEQTVLARQKQEKLKEEFKNWIFLDPERRNILVKKYNETFNCIVDRKYDGSFLTFPRYVARDKIERTSKKCRSSYFIWRECFIWSLCWCRENI